MRKDPPLNVIGRWTYVNVVLTVVNGASIAWILLGGKTVLIAIQILLIVLVSAFIYVLIVGIRRALDECEDRYAVCGSGVVAVLIVALIALIIWTIKEIL